MGISIDRKNGNITFGRFQVGQASDLSSLKEIDENNFRLIDSNEMYKYFSVCQIEMPFAILSLIAHFKSDHIWAFSLQVNVTVESWENWSDEDASLKLSELIKILSALGFRNPEDMPWGHVQAEIESRSGSIQIVVAYYKARRQRVFE